MLRGYDRRAHPRGRVAGAATVLPMQGKPGEYLVDDVSASGARLVGDRSPELAYRCAQLTVRRTRLPSCRCPHAQSGWPRW